MSQDSAATVLSSPFIPSSASVSAVMRVVIYALLPGLTLYIWFFGWGVLLNILLAIASAFVFEWVMLILRDRPVRPYLLDGSAIVTAILLALTMPPMVSWWIPVLGSFFAIVVAKHLYGGIGYNTFNPAMAAYAVLLISFPREMSLWSMPVTQLPVSLDFKAFLNYSFFHSLPLTTSFDALTSATLLDQLKTQTGLGKAVHEINDAHMFGYVAGTGMEWVSLAFLGGGLWLLYKKIISWHIPVAMLTAIAVIAGLCYVINPAMYANPLLHLFGGASILGAFFIATDPVTASTTPFGRILYGCGIGLLTYCIRTWGGYPDGVAFAVLLMGLTVPVLDHYTLPRVYGARGTNK